MIPGFNTNPGMAQATSWFHRNWLPHGIYAQTCPPTCPTIKDKNTKIHYVKLGQALLHLGENKYLAEWHQIPLCPGKNENGIKQFDRSLTPTFKNMEKPEVYNQLEMKVQAYKDTLSDLKPTRPKRRKAPKQTQ